MAQNSDYAKVLAQAFAQGESLAGSGNVDSAIADYINQHPELVHPLKTLQDGEETELGSNMAEGVKNIIQNLKQSKYLYSILITGLVQKLVAPQQDIRLIQSGLQGGYSNRSTDQTFITPFLKRHGLTACAASGMESGRNLERPIPHTLNLNAKTRGRGSLKAYLGILHAVQEEGISPMPILVLLIALDLRNKGNAIYSYPDVQELTIEEIHEAVLKHFARAKGNGRARLPVLAIQAIYQCLVPQLARYRNTSLRNPPNRHTGNDKEGWVGDIQVDHDEGYPFEAVEVKSEKQINADMIRALLNKFRGNRVRRYYFLSTRTNYVNDIEAEEVKAAISSIRQQTGCQVIVNGLTRSIWYYLRLIEDADAFIKLYTEQLQIDPDVKDEHRKLWADILVDIESQTK